MQVNKSKINLTNKICSTLFFVFAIISFLLSVLGMVNLKGDANDLTSKYIFNYGLSIAAFISIGLNIYLIIGLMLLDTKNYKDLMLYILSIIAILSIVSYTYGIVGINKNYTKELTSEFWLILVASGFSILFGGWYCLISWNLLKPLSFNRPEVENTSSTEQESEIKEEPTPTESTSTNA